MFSKVSLLFLITTSYTFIRYLVFGNVSVENIPVFLLNKSIAWSGVCCLLLAALNLRTQTQNQAQKAKLWGIAAFHFSSIHLLMSVIILNQGYFPKFFDSTRMNLIGELMVLFGVLATYLFWSARQRQLSMIKPKVLQSIALMFILGHLFCIGYTGWLKVEVWQGNLPPISLLSFIVIFISLLLLLKFKIN